VSTADCYILSVLTKRYRYTSALKSLSHALLLSPQNPFTVLQYAETAYSAGDLPLALKMFLVVIDMDDESAAQEPPRGISFRAWLGIKLVRRLSTCIYVYLMCLR